MKKASTDNKEYQFNKHLQIIEKYYDLLISLKDHISSNGYKVNKKNRLIPIFYCQIKSNLKRIVVEKSFFKQNKSLLLELMDLSAKYRSIILVTAFESVYNISLVNREVIIH
jgi:hypothetical protein